MCGVCCHSHMLTVGVVQYKSSQQNSMLAVQVADTDLQTLLLWKNVRMPFKEQNPVTLSVP